MAHKHNHYTMALVGYANELFELFNEETIHVYTDDKSKVNVGTLTVSCYFQFRRFFPVGDSPVYGDHDFPYARSKITPSR